MKPIAPPFNVALPLFALCLCLFLSSPWCQAQIIPDAPVLDFKLPMFGRDGYKIWDLSGREGLYVSPEKMEVRGMTLRVFSGGAGLSVEMVMESPSASVFTEKGVAQGKDRLKITGPNYLIEGKGWVWRARSHRIQVEKEVRVTFKEKLTDILK